MKKFTVLLIMLLAFGILPAGVKAQGWWEVQSVDTMKYSRDLARIKNNDKAFTQVIETQIKNIAGSGATHVAIDTPYDEEFVPFLREWVNAARKYNLKIWFRGNWSGWEGWFGYPAITRDEHLKKTVEFINENRDLFINGDIFTPCPECENGGPGDPRKTGDKTGFSKFMIDEYQETSRAFAEKGLWVATNYDSMNADVARLVMDKQTTKAMGGLVVIDNYVKSPSELAADVKEIADQSGGRVILGEFGVPVPDINGNLTEDEQAGWIKSALSQLARINEVVGVNYWVSVGGTTQVWTATGSALEAVGVLNSFYDPPKLSVTVKNEIGRALAGATISYRDRSFTTGDAGLVTIPINSDTRKLGISENGYQKYSLLLGTNQTAAEVVLRKSHENLLFKMQKLIAWIRGKI